MKNFSHVIISMVIRVGTKNMTYDFMTRKWSLVIFVIVINVKFWCNEKIGIFNYPTYDHYILPLTG